MTFNSVQVASPALMMQPLTPALSNHTMPSLSKSLGERSVRALISFIPTGSDGDACILAKLAVTFQKQSDSHVVADVLPVHLCRYVILGNHDYGDKCYDEPPGCYIYGGDAFYSPLHQVPYISRSE